VVSGSSLTAAAGRLLHDLIVLGTCVPLPIVNEVQRRDVAVHDACGGGRQRAHGCGGHARLLQHNERRVQARSLDGSTCDGLGRAARLRTALHVGSNHSSCMWRHEASSRSAAPVPHAPSRFEPRTAGTPVSTAGIPVASDRTPGRISREWSINVCTRSPSPFALGSTARPGDSAFLFAVTGDTWFRCRSTLLLCSDRFYSASRN
jgi:hypothetical protein